jgi:hypothetical protein
VDIKPEEDRQTNRRCLVWWKGERSSDHIPETSPQTNKVDNWVGYPSF